VTIDYAEVSFVLYVLMLRDKYDTNMNVQIFIRLSIYPCHHPERFHAKTVLQNLYVSLVRLKPYNSDRAFCNRAVTIELKLDG
jgi:hypothetical protein